MFIEPCSLWLPQLKNNKIIIFLNILYIFALWPKSDHNRPRHIGFQKCVCVCVYCKYPISIVTMSHYNECPPSAMKDMFFQNNIPENVPVTSSVVVEDWLFPYVKNLIKYLDDVFGSPDGEQIGGLVPGCILCFQ